MMRLDSKVAIVTGGARGIGRATALLFASEGARVVIADLDDAAGTETAAAITTAGAAAVYVRTDVSNPADARALVARAREQFGKIDILINNAGITRDATLAKMTDDQFDAVIQVNLKGVFNCAQAVIPVMTEAGYGRIVNTSSVVALYGNFGQTNYVAAKSGVVGMTRVWARELGRKGITVNAVAPGFIATDMIASVPEKVLAMIRERTPLQRLGEPVEVARAYLFLASDEASFVNGAVLSVDGGMVW
jgi:3-oxoacyl-[acyl-carrier protein] reductase